MSDRIASLPIATVPGVPHPVPVPWFVHWEDGKPDFRVVGAGKIEQAWTDHLCWTCGQKTGRNVAYVIGPMCSINRVSSEPPSHRECAIYSAKHCPFLISPARKRRENNLPEDTSFSGEMLRRNPGVALVWVTIRSRTEPFAAPGGGMLFDVGEPEETLWFARGRPATRAEVIESIESGCPLLMETALEEGPRAVAALEKMKVRAERYWPSVAAGGAT